MSETNGFDDGDGELLLVFLEETREQIEILDNGLIRLEREPENTELIQGIFRAAHTLKGSSGTMGFKQMADLTHAMEDILDRVRQHTIEVTADVVDALLRGLDLLREMETSIESGEGSSISSDTPVPLATELRSIAAGKVSAPQTAQAEQKPLEALDDDHIAMLINFSPECEMPGIRAFMALRALENHGDITDSVPSREIIDEGSFGSRILLVLNSTHPDEVLRQAVMSIPEVEWVRVARGAAAAGMRIDLPSRESLTSAESAESGDTNTRQATSTGSIHTQQTVRVNVETLDSIMNLVGELVLDRTRVARFHEDLIDRHPEDEELIQDIDGVSHHLGTIIGDLHEQVLQTRMLPVSQLFNRFPRMVRDLSRSLGKDIEFTIEGEHEQLDRSVIEKLVDPLTHILRNSLDHGMEKPDLRIAQDKPARGNIHLSARREESHVLIQVIDDGPGINIDRLKEKAIQSGLLTTEQADALPKQEAIALIFQSGLSTAKEVSDVSGRGVGMDVVKRNVESLGGTIAIESEQGQGTITSLKIPLTLAIVRALIVRVGRVAMALPLAHIEEAIDIPRSAVSTVRGRAIFPWRDQVVPVIRLADALPGCGESTHGKMIHLVAVRYDRRVVCLAVDAIIGHQEIVVKSLGGYLGDISGLAGATILGNGRVALIVDIGKLFEDGYLQEAAAGGIDSKYASVD